MMDQIFNKTIEFINLCNIIHNNKYDYSNLIFINSITKVNFTCKKHKNIISMLPGNHKQGRGCKICAKELKKNLFSSNTILFIEKACKIHKNNYLYNNVNYVNAKTKVKIICKIHGSFEQTPDSHLAGKGCNLCKYEKASILSAKTQETFLQEANIIHKNKYNYINSFYINENSKLNISCPLHGEFIQTASNHLRGQGCKKCSNINVSIYQSNNPSGWSLKHWIKKSKDSKYFDSFKIYIIECWDDKENFYKIGRTYTTIKNRFENKSKLPYNYKIIKAIPGNPNYIFNLEKELKIKFKKYKYIPMIKFNGRQECFNINIDKNEFNIY